jgi:hypothetical protein
MTIFLLSLRSDPMALSSTNVPSKRGRKPYTTPDVIDFTGKRHFMIVRRKKSKTCKKKIQQKECKNCELSHEYVDILEGRINRIGELINVLNKVINTKYMPVKSFPQFSGLDINFLLTLSETLILCQNHLVIGSNEFVIPQKQQQSINYKI